MLKIADLIPASKLGVSDKKVPYFELLDPHFDIAAHNDFQYQVN